MESWRRLTRAELAVVRAILAGHTTTDELERSLRQVYAPWLPMSRRTIQAHLNNIYGKTLAQNKTDIVLMANGVKACAIDLVGQLNEQR